MSKALGVDLGTVRTGVAIEVLGIAQPLAVLTETGPGLIAAIAEVAREQEATEIVVGLPLRLDGSDGPAAARSRGFAEDLRAATSLPVSLWDERLSTAESERALVGAGVRRRRRRQVVDRLAAAVMLQGYLDGGRQRR